jgi:hypothetical protein
VLEEISEGSRGPQRAVGLMTMIIIINVNISYPHHLSWNLKGVWWEVSTKGTAAYGRPK